MPISIPGCGAFLSPSAENLTNYKNSRPQNQKETKKHIDMKDEDVARQIQLYKIRPLVVRREDGPFPFLAVRVLAVAGEEAVVGALHHIEPGRGFGALEPLDCTC